MNQASQDAADHETAVSTMYGELTEQPALGRYAEHMEALVQQARTVFEEKMLPVAIELVGDTPADRAVATEAVMSVMLTRLNDEIQALEAALALGHGESDQG